MLNCKEVTRKVASDYFSAASRWERFMMRFHLMMCRHCRRYQRQIRDICGAARELWEQPADDDTLERLESQILDTLRDNKVDPLDQP